MTKSKLIRVLDEGTDMVFMVSKFEASDIELLGLKGWKLSPELTMITNIGPAVACSLSTFKFPHHDIRERSEKLRYSHTTHGLAKVVKDLDFDDIPDTIDVEDVDCTR